MRRDATDKQMWKIRFIMEEKNLRWKTPMRSLMLWDAVKIIDVLTGKSEKESDIWEVNCRMYKDPEYYEGYEEVVLYYLRDKGYAVRNEIIHYFREFYDPLWHSNDYEFNRLIIEKMKVYDERLLLENPFIFIISGSTKKRMEELNIPTEHFSKKLYILMSEK